MSAQTKSTVILSPLQRADGSATFSQNGYTIIGAVNGPIDVQRRDELPEEAAIDVTIRPLSGVGGTRERHLEAILQSTLRHIILIKNFPRTLIQVTLQTISSPENEAAYSKPIRTVSDLPILPVLLQASFLALLSSTIPLTTTMTSTIIALKSDKSTRRVIPNPTFLEVLEATSLHVMAFTSHRELIVSVSEGSFTMDEWDQAHENAEHICCGLQGTIDVDAMRDNGDDAVGMIQLVKSSIQERITADLHWKG